MQAQELLADIAVLEVAVLKLKEKSTALRSQLGQERTEHEIAELYRERSGPILQPKGQGSAVPPPSPQQMIICADSQCNRPSHALVTPEQPEFLTATSVQDDKTFPCSPSPGHLWKVSPFGSWPLYCMFMLFPDISGILQTQILLMGGLCAGASVQFSPQRSLFCNPGYSRRRSTIFVTFAESAASKSTQRQTMPVSRVMPAT